METVLIIFYIIAAIIGLIGLLIWVDINRIEYRINTKKYEKI